MKKWECEKNKSKDKRKIQAQNIIGKKVQNFIQGKSVDIFKGKKVSIKKEPKKQEECKDNVKMKFKGKVKTSLNFDNPIVSVIKNP